LNGDLFLLLGAYVGGIVCTTFYLTRLREGRTRAALVFGAAALAGGVLTVYQTLYSFGGGFGYGVMLCFAAASLGAALAAWLLVVTIRILRSALRQGTTGQRVLALAGIPLLILSVFAPVLGPFGMGEICDRLNRDRAQTLIAGTQAYQSDNSGAFPADLAALLPGYVTDLPQPACFPGGSAWDYKNYTLMHCPTGETLLTIYTIRGVTVQRYNFQTGQWSSISFLDGECNFLR
jgi:hypothetical protein